jgi:histidyl-tRNA synthetase
VLVYDPAVPLDRLVAIKSELIARGQRVRLDRRPKNLKAVLDRAAAAGFRSFAFVNPETADASELELKPLG